MIIPLATAPNL